MAEQDTMKRIASHAARPRRGARVHMGTATSDPDYLPLTDFQRRYDDAHPQQTSAASSLEAGAPASRPAPLHGGRYLSRPRQRKSIFTRQERQRRRAQLILIALLVLAVALVLAWFFFLR